MLVLSRKLGEKIVIADVVTIAVLEIRGDKVRIGIDAPTEVTVHRQEVYDAIQRKTKDVPQVHVDPPTRDPSGDSPANIVEFGDSGVSDPT